VVDYLRANRNFGMRIEISREETLLDTGGGLKQAAWFFLEAGSNHPFILHNVDVISTIDLSRMVQFHHEQNALAALAVQARESSRMLRFNETAQLCGRRVMHSTDDSQTEWAHPLEHGQAQVQALAFSGIHVLSPNSTNPAHSPSSMPICVSPHKAKESSPSTPTRPIGATSAAPRASRPQRVISKTASFRLSAMSLKPI